MSVAAYMPTTPEERVDRIQEESAEVIIAVSKLKRFGNRRWPSADSETNFEAVEREIRDLLEAYELVRQDKIAAGEIEPDEGAILISPPSRSRKGGGADGASPSGAH